MSFEEAYGHYTYTNMNPYQASGSGYVGGQEPYYPPGMHPLWSTSGSFIVSMLQLRGSYSPKHLRSLELHHQPWYTAAGNAGYNDTQHPAHSVELGVDIRLAVRCVQRLHSLGVGLPTVPAVPAAPAIPIARTGEL